jgi:hypothetical protein
MGGNDVATGGPVATAGGESGTANPAPTLGLLDMIWPETGLQVGARLPSRPKDALGADDLVELQIDFVTLSLTPLEFIQLASSLRMSIDVLLEQHPSWQRAVINAFDLRE